MPTKSQPIASSHRATALQTYMFLPTNGHCSEAHWHLAPSSSQADVMLRTNFFRCRCLHLYQVLSPGFRPSQSHSGPLWSGYLPWCPLNGEYLLARVSEPCWWYPDCSGTWLPYTFPHTVRDPSPSAPAKSVWSLGGFGPIHVFYTECLEKPKLSPPNSVMLSFCSRLSNWRVDNGLLGSQGLRIHGVQL